MHTINYFLDSFLQKDNLLINGRLYSINFNKDSADYFVFNGLRFGIERGPFLDDLEKNTYKRFQEEIFFLIRDNSKEFNQIQKRIVSISGDHKLLAEFVLNEVIPYANFSDSIHTGRGAIVEDFVSVEDVIKIQENIFSELNYDYLRKELPWNCVMFNGCGYLLRNASRDRLSLQENHARVGGRTYRLIDSKFDVSKNILTATNKLEKDIETRVSSHSVLRKLRKTNNIGKHHYDANKNIGFDIISNDSTTHFFVYCNTPDFILVEKNINPPEFYAFDSTRVGVELKINAGKIHLIVPPCVIDSYIHPSIPDTKEYPLKRICFEGFNYDLAMNRSLVEGIVSFLNEAVKRLTTRYKTGSRAFNKLYIPEIREAFSGLRISPGDVDPKKVNNCLRGELSILHQQALRYL